MTRNCSAALAAYLNIRRESWARRVLERLGRLLVALLARATTDIGGTIGSTPIASDTAHGDGFLLGGTLLLVGMLQQLPHRTMEELLDLQPRQRESERERERE